MKVKIAIASTDGKVVNQHFGRADRFYIVLADEEDGHYEYIEERKVKAVCQGGDHEPSQLQEAAAQLSDCQYLLVSRVGIRARNELENSGIAVFEIPEFIDTAVDKLIKYTQIQKLLSG